MSNIAKIEPRQELAPSDHGAAIRTALKTSLYPGAADASIDLVLAYCRAAGLDPMQKPVHIVPMWDSKAGAMRDVVMPGIGLYRTQAARTGRFAGQSEPEYGPLVTASIGGQEITYPEWARVTVKKALDGGIIAEFTAREFWLENYAVKGGKEKSVAPNAMWTKRPHGQIGKCAAAQALRLAFPEMGAQPTAEEMEGKTIEGEFTQPTPEEIAEREAARKKAAHDEALGRHSESIAHIKERLAAEDFAAAATEWRLIPQDDQRALWVSTRVEGACFTTAERDAIKTKLPSPEPQK